MIFNMVGGGGGIAHILAIYPSGSTCTCKQGSTTFTAPDTSGIACFTIPTTGAWTVTITSGSSTASRTVDVTLGGAYEVRIMYKQYMVDNGVVQNQPTLSHNGILVNRNASGQDVTNSFAIPHHVWRWSTIGYEGCHFYVMFGPYDISNAKQIVYDNFGFGYIYSEWADREGGFGLMYEKTTSYADGTTEVLDSLFATRKKVNNKGDSEPATTYTLDISQYLGIAYVAIHWQGKNGYNVFNDVRNLYIE